MYCRKTARGNDPRIFHNFYLYCLRHGSKFRSVGELEDHRKRNGEGRTGLSILCRCCGSVCSVMEKLSAHTNTEAFHLRTSSIPGYVKASFSARNYVADRRNQKALLEAAVEARSAASAARQAKAAAAVASTRCLWGTRAS